MRKLSLLSLWRLGVSKQDESIYQLNDSALASQILLIFCKTQRVLLYFEKTEVYQQCNDLIATSNEFFLAQWIIRIVSLC